jgi:hypothetical protein
VPRRRLTDPAEIPEGDAPLALPLFAQKNWRW